MRAILVAATAAGLALAGCSEQTQESAGEMVESAADDVAANTERAIAEAERTIDNIGDEVGSGTAQTEAEVQGETPAEARRD